ncbi:hypothetical protein V2I01_41800 [Micromonospora sp. BRA006-A]|nr:hypothetical protein [Micromonospora sp. BRA006-A]
MTALTIAGWGVVGPAADSPEALATALGAAPQPVPVTGMYADELPDARARPGRLRRQGAPAPPRHRLLRPAHLADRSPAAARSRTPGWW